jgi:hypothetical protein
MNIEDVELRVENIRERAGDDEVAHGMEDDLHQDVLRAIAAGTCSDPVGCAASALKTCDIDFARWCA